MNSTQDQQKEISRVGAVDYMTWGVLYIDCRDLSPAFPMLMIRDTCEMEMYFVKSLTGYTSANFSPSDDNGLMSFLEII